MRRFTVTLLLLGAVSVALQAASEDEEQIRQLTTEFCQAIVSKDLSIIDRVFDSDPSNIYYDINEGPLTGLDRLKRVWRAATTNFTISQFSFSDDMKVDVFGDHALQTGTWTQTQESPDGTSREIVGRATILWKKTPDGWKAFHYHASITPPRRRR